MGFDKIDMAVPAAFCEQDLPVPVNVRTDHIQAVIEREASVVLMGDRKGEILASGAGNV